jgi:hypothetical protein
MTIDEEASMLEIFDTAGNKFKKYKQKIGQEDYAALRDQNILKVTF